MNDQTIGRIVRAIRLRSGWRQHDLAARSGVSRTTVARIERGQLRGVAIDRLRRVLEALHARADIAVRWSGGEIDRLMNARHSAMHERVAWQFRTLSGWEIAPEVSFSIYGERGVIDILAWHPASRTVLVIELKTEIVDVNELMRKADQRRRLAGTIAAGRGWPAVVAGTWIVVADSRTNRRRLAAHRAVLRTAFPVDGRTVPGWLRNPSGSLAALSFMTDGRAVDGRIGLAAPKRAPPTSPSTACRGRT